MQIKKAIEKHLDQIVADRRHIHQNPELSHKESETAAYIAEQLRGMGLSPKMQVGGNGVVALIEGPKPGKCVALRADFDALPVLEATGLPFASQNEGICHACGHDMHTATLLGAARVLCDLKDQIIGSVKLVFQPAEEDVLDSGAPKMIAEGLLENPKVDAMFGGHVWPYYPAGSVAIRDGSMMASSDRFDIVIHGKGSHGSAPEDGIDAIVIAAQFVSALQGIVSRQVSPLDSAVVTVGTIQGGTRYNVIADSVKLEGTVRNLNPVVRNKTEGRIRAILDGVCSAFGATAEMTYFMGYSPTVNSPELFPFTYETIRDVVGDENIYIPSNSALGGEDFSFYCERVPSCLFWIGCQTPDAPFFPLHNGGLSPDEGALPVGVEVMVNCALRYLTK